MPLNRFKEYRGEVTAIDQENKTIVVKTPFCDAICHYDRLDSEAWDILLNSLRFYDKEQWNRAKQLVYVREKREVNGYKIGEFSIDYVEALSSNDPFYWIQTAEQIGDELDDEGNRTFDKNKLKWFRELFEKYPDDLPYPSLGFHEFRYDCVDIGVEDQASGSEYYLGIIVVSLDTHKADVIICPRDEDSEEEDKEFTLDLNKEGDIKRLWDLIRKAKDGTLSLN